MLNLTSKTCFTCGEEKPVNKFPTRKKTLKTTGETKEYYLRNCWSCHGKADYYRRKQNPDFVKKKNAYYLSYLRKDKTMSMLYTAKHKSKREGIPFNLDKSDLFMPELCPLLGIKLNCDNTIVSDSSPSLDRIFPDKGYVKGNVWIISNKANTMKNSATVEEIEMLAKNLRVKIDERTHT
jgi:hypothetical protein